MSRRAYRAVLVKNAEVADVRSRLSDGKLWVGVDVGKAEAFAVIRDSKGAFERPWKVKLPGEIRELVSRLESLGSGDEITVVMESTGTYGEALRQVGGLAIACRVGGDGAVEGSGSVADGSTRDLANMAGSSGGVGVEVLAGGDGRGVVAVSDVIARAEGVRRSARLGGGRSSGAEVGVVGPSADDVGEDRGIAGQCAHDAGCAHDGSRRGVRQTVCSGGVECGT